ncbi:MAG: hypothetical protein JXQ76_04285 [Campylobacterales bacterium]|nr:hypothetical protein [Campylobacterales bacterium]
MQELQINNPQLQDIFKTKFHSNQEQFMESILSFIQDNKKVIDSYFQQKKKPTFKYKKLDPMQNYYTIDKIDDNKAMSNPFEDVQDSVVYAKKLRQDSYR